MRDCALGWGPGKGRVPAWLQKWVSLALEYVEMEQRLLPPALLAIQPAGVYTPATAAAEAKGTIHTHTSTCPLAASSYAPAGSVIDQPH